MHHSTCNCQIGWSTAVETCLSLILLYNKKTTILRINGGTNISELWTLVYVIANNQTKDYHPSIVS